MLQGFEISKADFGEILSVAVAAGFIGIGIFHIQCLHYPIFHVFLSSLHCSISPKTFSQNGYISCDYVQGERRRSKTRN